VTNDQIAGHLENAAHHLAEEEDVNTRIRASMLFDAARTVRELPEFESEVPTRQVPLEDEMDEHLAEAVRISDGVREGYVKGGVFARKIHTYEGHPYLVIIHDLDDLGR